MGNLDTSKFPIFINRILAYLGAITSLTPEHAKVE